MVNYEIEQVFATRSVTEMSLRSRLARLVSLPSRLASARYIERRLTIAEEPTPLDALEPIRPTRSQVEFDETDAEFMNPAMAEATARTIRATMRRSATLDLRHLGLAVLPKELEQLTWLQHLDLSGNRLVSFPDILCQLIELRSLDLARNQMTTVIPTIGRLSRLQLLDLRSNKLTELPDTIGQLGELHTLMIGDNRLTRLPDTIGRLTQLRGLDVAGNRLDSLPETIGQLTALQTLSLGIDTEATRRVDGPSNRITALPEAIGRLTELRHLDLCNNRLTALPGVVGQLTKLEHLAIGNNRLTSLPDAIGKLTQLAELYLYGNSLATLPDTARELTQLRALYLRRNLLNSLPKAIAYLTKLEILDVSDNGLQELPIWLEHIGSLQRLLLHDNSDLGLPTELLDPFGDSVKPSDVLDYYFRIHNDGRSINEAKLILVGFGEVGKSSLVNRLVKDNFNTREGKTEGIAITDWRLRLISSETIQLHVWDFGGQEIMHATHQFFLTQRSLYLVVLNGRGGRQQTDAAYWLDLIAIHAPDSPVIIVRNKIREDPCALDRIALRRDFPAIRAVIDTDCADRTGIDDLTAAIRRETDALPELRSRFPAAWFAIKDRLSAMPENYMSFADYRALCASNGETDPAAQEALAFVLHCLGIVLNYRDDPRLHDTNVLNPHWVTEGVYRILNHPALTAGQAELRVADLRSILDPTRFPPERHDFLLQLMRRFELAVPFPEQADLYLVPERLNPEQPADIGESDAARCLNFAYDYPTLLPEGLLPRFIVRTHTLSTGCPRWRSGVVLRMEDNRALVIGDAINHRVSITIDGRVAGRRRLLAVIRYDLEHIHRSYQFQPQAIVPVPGRPDVVVPYYNLVTFERDDLPRFPVVIEGRTVMLDVRQLLDGVDLAPPKPADPTARRETQPTTAFISYAHKDEPLRAELDTHLKLLQVTGELDAWHDRSITPGEKWEGQINDNLQRADIVLLLLSPDFIASDYCRKEMEIALQREAVGQTRVVPIIARPCGWRHLPVQANQALPRHGKPVADAGHDQGHRDAAWVEVEDGIRRLLKAIRPAR